MTNEWGPPLTGEEMRALKGRIDPETMMRRVEGSFGEDGPYCNFGFLPGYTYHLLANHPYYKVREYNQRHGTNLVLHDGSAKVPEDWDGDLALYESGVWTRCAFSNGWRLVIAYTPKPKESEVTYSFDDIPQGRKVELRKEGALPGSGLSPCEQFPSDEAIEYVLRKCEYEVISVERVKEDPIDYRGELLAARLIQQYEPDRLKPAVDIAAEEWVEKYGHDAFKNVVGRESFKAGVAWQKENSK